jgi:hypothetical protein
LSSGTISTNQSLKTSLINAVDMGKNMINLVPMKVRDQLSTGKEHHPRSCPTCLRRGRNCSITADKQTDRRNCRWDAKRARGGRKRDSDGVTTCADYPVVVAKNDRPQEEMDLIDLIKKQMNCVMMEMLS